jgi:cytochrome oxidase Cu insertion factor (SCO1/SenC/PrrC family)
MIRLLSTRRNQLTLIFLLAILPALVASLLYYGGYFVPEKQVNKGRLILPPESINDLALQGVSLTAQKALAERKWRLLYMVGQNCTEPCQARLTQLSNVQAALGRHQSRVQGVLVTEQPANSAWLNKIAKFSYQWIVAEADVNHINQLADRVINKTLAHQQPIAANESQ